MAPTGAGCRRRFGLVEAVAPIKAYIDRWNARPSVKKVAQIDADLLMN